jgi:hypothetical protein
MDDSLRLVRLRLEKLEGLYARCDGAGAMGYRSLTSTFTLTARHSRSSALVVNWGSIGQWHFAADGVQSPIDAPGRGHGRRIRSYTL